MAPTSQQIRRACQLYVYGASKEEFHQAFEDEPEENIYLLWCAAKTFHKMDGFEREDEQ